MTDSVISRETASVLSEVPVGTAEPPRGFARDKLTWAGYALYGYWSYLWGAFGVAVPYLRTQFHMDYSTSALHFSALAVGPFLAGFFGERVTSFLGLAKTVYLGNAIMMAGALLLVYGFNPACTIGGAFLIGLGGNVGYQATVASMSHRFGEGRAIGIAEIQIAGTVCCLLAPLTVITRYGIEWRTVLIASVVLFAVYFATSLGVMRRFGNKLEKKEHRKDSNALPGPYWLYFAVVFFSVASEWSVAFWCSEFLAKVVKVPESSAALGMSVLLGALLVGRIIGVRLLHVMSVYRLAALSAVLAAVGFVIFWLSRDLYLSLFGLIILGLGESNVYPLCYSQAIGLARGATEAAAARMSLSSGAAILIAPLLLGILADKVGICNSYSLVAVCLVAAAIAVIFVKPAPKEGYGTSKNPCPS